MPRCSRCNIPQPLDAFYQRSGRKNRSSICMPCRRKYERERYTKGTEERLAATRQRRYGLTPQEIVQMFKDQNYTCACCNDPLPENRKHVHIDHDHKTGIVRGILCRNCNLTVAYGRDDPARLRAAAWFLERHIAKSLPCPPDNGLGDGYIKGLLQ